jgi:hypothetical protein
MNKLSYHGRTRDQAKWVVEFFGNKETQEMHKDNESFQEWYEACRQLAESDRINL